MIQTQTFEVSKTAKDELEVLSRALQLMKEGRHDEAAKVLIARHDLLMRDPELKLYDQRAA